MRSRSARPDRRGPGGRAGVQAVAARTGGRRERDRLLDEQHLLLAVAEVARRCAGRLPAALLDDVLRGGPRLPAQRRAVAS